VMISTRSGVLVIDTVVCLTLAKWETVSGRFGGYLNYKERPHSLLPMFELGAVYFATSVGTNEPKAPEY
jgi:hypothetical protein